MHALEESNFHILHIVLGGKASILILNLIKINSSSKKKEPCMHALIICMWIIIEYADMHVGCALSCPTAELPPI
jgi:hypothetical protein